MGFFTKVKQEEPKKEILSAVGIACRIIGKQTAPRTYGDATETGVGTGIYKNVSRR